MNRKNPRPLRRARVVRSVFAPLVALGFFVPCAAGQYVPQDPIVRVEEDWEIELNVPENALEAPQFHTVMSSTGDLDGAYAQFAWNYWSEPTFTAGGMQVQGWYGDHLFQESGLDRGLLSTVAETIRWTQVLHVTEGVVKAEVINGLSETWGTFGGLKVIVSPGEGVILNAYSPQVSVENSAITFGSNRVERLTLRAVRRYFLSGSIHVDTTPRTVYEDGGDD